MGVQSTVTITREEAEKKYVAKRLDLMRTDMAILAHTLSDAELEDVIEEYFYNYTIQSNPTSAERKVI